MNPGSVQQVESYIFIFIYSGYVLANNVVLT